MRGIMFVEEKRVKSGKNIKCKKHERLLGYFVSAEIVKDSGIPEYVENERHVSKTAHPIHTKFLKRK